jgi:hypothetical protein
MSRRPGPALAFHGQARWPLAAHLLCVCLLGACSAVPLATPSSRGPNSFLGVNFGNSLMDAEKLHPLGSAEISPRGSEAYRLTDVVAGAASYQWVIYEFTSGHGMQLVVARFNPDSSDQIFEELHKTFGNPGLSDGASSADASIDTWLTAGGTSVKFDGPHRQLIMVGEHGKSLELDVALRAQLQNY